MAQNFKSRTTRLVQYTERFIKRKERYDSIMQL